MHEGQLLDKAVFYWDRQFSTHVFATLPER